MNPVDDPRLPAERLLRAAFGAQAAQILYVAAKLGLADRLQHGTASAAELAAVLDVDALGLQRLLRALVGLGVCNEPNECCFGLTPLGQYLRTDHPDSVVARVVLNVEVHHALWNDLLATVRTGESASRRVYGVPFYEYLQRNRAAGAAFDQAMAGGGWIRHRLRPALEAYDFGQFRSIVDIGGGNGALMAEILLAHPRVRGTVYDLSRLAPAAQSTLAEAGVTDRCDFVAGDALASVPEGHDGYVLSNFINSLSDDDALTVLRHCRRAIHPDGKLLLLDWVQATGDDLRDSYRAWDTVTMDIVMLAAFGSRGGRMRTSSEFRSLLDLAAFTVTALVPTCASIFVIEAQPR
ncbi:MAG: methyltransferase [Candidatus Levyibacteriota bacterium]